MALGRCGALAFELCATSVLAELRVVQGRGAEVPALLRPIYERVQEGHGTAPVRAAQGLLPGQG